MKRFVQTLEPLSNSTSQLTSGRKESNGLAESSFIPFHNERDALGRLLTKPRRECPGGAASLSKIRPRRGKKGLLIQLMDDMKANVSEVLPTSNEKLETAFEYGGWKTYKIVPKLKPDSETNTPKQNKKITQSNLTSIIQQKDKTYSKVMWPSMSNLDTDRSNILPTPPTQTNSLPTSVRNIRNHPEKKSGFSVVKDPLPRVPGSYKNNSNKENLKTLHVSYSDKDYFKKELDTTVIRRPSVQKMLDGKSYFKNLKTEDNPNKFIEDTQIFQSKVTDMKERLSNLKTSIGDVYIHAKSQMAFL